MNRSAMILAFALATTSSGAVASYAAMHAGTPAFRGRWTIPEGTVLQAVQSFLAAHGAGEAGQLSLANNPRLAAVTPEARLEVARMHWDYRRQQPDFLVRCVVRTECGSILVQADLPSGSMIHTQAKGLLAMSGRPPVAMVRPGTPALLRWEHGPVRISLPVVCLQRGAAGESVRVRDPVSGHVLVARVAGPGDLRLTSTAKGGAL